LPAYVLDRDGEMKSDATPGRMNDKIVMWLKGLSSRRSVTPGNPFTKGCNRLCDSAVTDKVTEPTDG
jgi:hypothetical protein